MEYDIASFHVNSFNYLLDEGINLAISDIPAEKLRLANGDAVEIRYCGATVGYPTLKDDLVSWFFEEKSKVQSKSMVFIFQNIFLYFRITPIN